MDKRVFRRC